MEMQEECKIFVRSPVEKTGVCLLPARLSAPVDDYGRVIDALDCSMYKGICLWEKVRLRLRFMAQRPPLPCPA